MTPIVFINCDDVPFVDKIISGEKKFETRTRNMLGALSGRRVLIAETGRHCFPTVRCSATIGTPIKILTKDVWDQNEWEGYRFRQRSCIPAGSKYDWKPDTKIKWIYSLIDVQEIMPFVPPEGKRHGRVWMEFEEE